MRPTARRRGRWRWSAGPPRPPRWGCRGSRGSGGHGPFRSGSWFPWFAISRLGVEAQALGLFELVPPAPLALGERRGGLHARAEAIGRAAEGELGVDAQLARGVDGGEEQVAD